MLLKFKIHSNITIRIKEYSIDIVGGYVKKKHILIDKYLHLVIKKYYYRSRQV